MQLCKMMGIKMSSRLIRNKTTHVLCCIDAGESDKLVNARAWGSVHIISIEWLVECVRTGRRATETEYLVGDALAVPDGAAAAPGVTVAAAADTSELSDALKDAAKQEGCDTRALQKPQGDEPDSMMDFVAKLTSVAKATGKRYGSLLLQPKRIDVSNARLTDAHLPGQSSSLLRAAPPR